MRKTKYIAYMAAIIAAISYGATVLVINKLVECADVFDVLSMRFLLAAVLSVILRLTGVIKVKIKASKKGIALLIGAVLCSPTLELMFETFGIKHASTLLVGVMSGMIPVFVLIFEGLLSHDKTSLQEKCFAAIRIFGVLLITFLSGNSGNNTILGVVFMLCTIICGAMYCVLTRKASKEVMPEAITYYGNITAAIAMNVINIIRRSTSVGLSGYFDLYTNADTALCLGYLMLVSIVGTGLHNFALSRIKASVVVTIGGLNMLTTIILSVVIKGEPLFIYHYIGIVLILVGIAGMSLASERSAVNRLKNKG